MFQAIYGYIFSCYSCGDDFRKENVTNRNLCSAEKQPYAKVSKKHLCCKFTEFKYRGVLDKTEKEVTSRRLPFYSVPVLKAKRLSQDNSCKYNVFIFKYKSFYYALQHLFSLFCLNSAFLTFIHISLLLLFCSGHRQKSNSALQILASDGSKKEKISVLQIFLCYICKNNIGL